jgi:hypothetical protein
MFFLIGKQAYKHGKIKKIIGHKYERKTLQPLPGEGVAFFKAGFRVYLYHRIGGVMNFTERMKEILDQGAAVSKDLAQKAGEKAQDWGERGYQASKDFVNKAGAKAQDLGERGVSLMEIKQLENRAQKLIARLGAEAYTLFADQGASTVSASDPVVKSILNELASVRESIEKREADLRTKKA